MHLNLRLLLATRVGLLATLAGGFAAAQAPLMLEPIASGFSQPLWMTYAPGDEAERLFVLEKNSGRVRIVDDGEILPEPFLDVGGIIATGNEEGLLSMAFDPAYASNGRVYVSIVRDRGLFNDNDSQLLRYTVSEDPNRLDPASQEVLMEFEQPRTNHNGGHIVFGPDGFLYYALGDGGGAGDPFENGQDMSTVYGAILRLDVSGAEAAAAPGNPFIGVAGADPRIWLYGVRNPWRFSFDRATGGLYVGDVGQGDFEEITFLPPDHPGGANLGWDIFEGDSCFDPDGDEECEPFEGYVPPIYTYGFPGSQSVTGGYVYRGGRIPFLQGTYFFADFITADIWSFVFDGENLSDFTERNSELNPNNTIFNISSFAEDADGELYLLAFDGALYKLVPDTAPSDINADAVTDAVDVQLVINGALGLDVGNAVVDIDGNGAVDAVDVQQTINGALNISTK